MLVGPVRHNRGMTELAWACLDTPVGPLGVGCTPAGIAQVRFSVPPEPVAGPGGAADAGPLLDAARTQLGEYFGGGRRAFELALDWTAVTGPQRLVLDALYRHVGYGQTVTYGELARRAGLTGDGTEPPARTVGRIMGSNPIPVIVPCHRVVASDGLGGFGGHTSGTRVEAKRWLLILEGALPPTLDWTPAGLAG